MWSIPVSPMMAAFGEEVVLQRHGYAEPVVDMAIVSIDTLVQEEGLSYRQSSVSAPADSPLADAAIGDILQVRGRSYTIQLVRDETDPGWKRALIA